MRRPLFVVLVLGGTFAGLLLLIMGLSVVPVTAVSADLPEAVVPEDIQVGTALTLTVNYAHDWVAGSTIGDATVAVTVTDNGGSVKATATITGLSNILHHLTAVSGAFAQLRFCPQFLLLWESYHRS